METVCVVGLGYIGLPTAAILAATGKHVVGVDLNEKILEAINVGPLHVEEPGLLDLVVSCVASGNLAAQDTPEVCDAYIIAVPTPLTVNLQADLQSVQAAARSLVPFLRPGCLVVLESTSPPGTTSGLVQPILEQSGLRAGVDFMLCYSPERVLPGRIMVELTQNDRVVGGINQISAQAGAELYASFVTGEIIETDAITAEAVKLIENTFRDVNIALANEFALIAETVGFNVWEAIRLANHHPRVRVLSPGPGVGGHCIAVDPWFLAQAAPGQSPLIQLARRINDGMPEHVVELVRSTSIGRTPTEYVIACLGMSFKADVDDIRESPAMRVIHLLTEEGYSLRCFDPHVKRLDPKFRSVTDLHAALSGADLLLLLVDHSEFRNLQPTQAWSMAGKQVIDTRGVLDAEFWVRSGFAVQVVGSHPSRKPD
ncbi:MAG: nucleotide sugar dehydrogenase [Fimbriimonas sp.]|nr:nucleotide sugar dehydrogenase [Fimbriimonas sp.]